MFDIFFTIAIWIRTTRFPKFLQNPSLSKIDPKTKRPTPPLFHPSVHCSERWPYLLDHHHRHRFGCSTSLCHGCFRLPPFFFSFSRVEGCWSGCGALVDLFFEGSTWPGRSLFSWVCLCLKVFVFGFVKQPTYGIQWVFFAEVSEDLQVEVSVCGKCLMCILWVFCSLDEDMFSPFAPQIGNWYEFVKSNLRSLVILKQIELKAFNVLVFLVFTLVWWVRWSFETLDWLKHLRSLLDLSLVRGHGWCFLLPSRCFEVFQT